MVFKNIYLNIETVWGSKETNPSRYRKNLYDIKNGHGTNIKTEHRLKLKHSDVIRSNPNKPNLTQSRIFRKEENGKKQNGFSRNITFFYLA